MTKKYVATATLMTTQDSWVITDEFGNEVYKAQTVPIPEESKGRRIAVTDSKNGQQVAWIQRTDWPSKSPQFDVSKGAGGDEKPLWAKVTSGNLMYESIFTIHTTDESAYDYVVKGGFWATACEVKKSKNDQIEDKVIATIKKKVRFTPVYTLKVEEGEDDLDLILATIITCKVFVG